MELNGAGIGCLAVVSIAAVMLFVVPQISDFVDEMSEETEVTTTNASSSQGTTSASFNKIKIEHNVYKDGVKGMNVIVDFDVKNMQGSKGSCAVYFLYDNGAKLKGRTNQYTTSDGQLAMHTNISPSYKVSCYNDVTLFVPYNEIVLSPGTHKLKCYSVVWDYQGSSYNKLASSKYAKFTLTQN